MKGGQVDLLALRYFREVARREHISDAATRLGVAQPSVSRTVARLEADLGIALFDRPGRRIRLNRHGHAFLRRVERALDELDDGCREMAEAAASDAGTVAIASETLLTLARVLAGFRAEHPGIEVRLQQASAVEMARLLREREVDLCLASQTLPGTGLARTRLLHEEVLLAVPHGHRLAGRESVAVAELVDEPFVTTAPGHWMRELLDRLFADAGLAARITCTGDEPAAILELVRVGLGVGLFPEMGREATGDSALSWVRLDTPASRRSLDLVWRADSPMSVAAQHLRAAALRHFGAGNDRPERARPPQEGCRRQRDETKA